MHMKRVLEGAQQEYKKNLGVHMDGWYAAC